MIAFLLCTYIYSINTYRLSSKNSCVTQIIKLSLSFEKKIYMYMYAYIMVAKAILTYQTSLHDHHCSHRYTLSKFELHNTFLLIVHH